jgi:hypothetical protein
MVYDKAKGTLALTQEQQVKQLLEKAGLVNGEHKVNPVRTPMHAPIPTVEDCPQGKLDMKLPNKYREWYQSMIGSLLYFATVTRIDIQFAVNYLARYTCNPGERHVAAVKHLLRYLLGTMNYGLLFDGNRAQDNNNVSCEVYGDADFAGCVATRKSTSGWLCLLDGNIVSWQSKLQSVVAGSTMHAEYIAAYHASSEAFWISQWFECCKKTLGCRLKLPVLLHCDNQAALALMDHDTKHDMTKTIGIKYHATRNRIEHGIVIPNYVKTDQQLADILTKPLATNIFIKLRDQLLVPIQLSS